MNDAFVSTILSSISVILTLGGLLGGIIAYRSGMARTASEVQAHVIEALEHEIALLRSRLDDLEKENKRLDQIIVTLCEALKKRGLVVTIDGTLITVCDGHDTHSVRIQGL